MDAISEKEEKKQKENDNDERKSRTPEKGTKLVEIMLVGNGRQGSQIDEITLMISTSWSTPLSPGNKGWEWEKENNEIQRIVNVQQCNSEYCPRIG